MSDPVDHPAHYTAHRSGIECIDVVEHMNFNRGNAVKYVWRAGHKGDELEDLKKARWYLDREIARLERAGPLQVNPGIGLVSVTAAGGVRLGETVAGSGTIVVSTSGALAR